MEQIATKLTPRIKEFIIKEFKSNYYDSNVNSGILFHYPNFFNGEGFKKGNHAIDVLWNGYKEVSEQEFLDYFKEEETCDWTKKVKAKILAYCEKNKDVLIEGQTGFHQLKPNHYSQTKSGMDVFDVARDWNIKDPELFSSLKYILRCGKKDEPIKEIDKAIDCLNRYKEVLNGSK